MKSSRLYPVLTNILKCSKFPNELVIHAKFRHHTFSIITVIVINLSNWTHKLYVPFDCFNMIYQRFLTVNGAKQLVLDIRLGKTDLGVL